MLFSLTYKRTNEENFYCCPTSANADTLGKKHFSLGLSLPESWMIDTPPTHTHRSSACTPRSPVGVTVVFSRAAIKR